MIAAALYAKSGVDKTARALRLVRPLARQGKRVTLIDAGLQGSALNRSEQCARRRFDDLFGLFGLIGWARDTLRCELALAAQIGQRLIFAEATRAGQLLFEQDGRSLAARNHSAGRRNSKARAMTVYGCCGEFAARPRDAECRINTPEPGSSSGSTGHIYTARLAVDIVPRLSGRIKIAAFPRGVTITDSLRDLPAREFCNADGGRL